MLLHFDVNYPAHIGIPESCLHDFILKKIESNEEIIFFWKHTATKY